MTRSLVVVTLTSYVIRLILVLTLNRKIVNTEQLAISDRLFSYHRHFESATTIQWLISVQV
ncbi:MAG: hypothetical protein RM021_017280 [Nostoc sp. EkiNYC01]|nr:hypothetical protein [Nostoc sp. EkiNYC01]